MRERSATCAFLAACVLLALLGLRAHAAGKEPMEVNGAKLFCELSGTLKKVAKEIAQQLTARQGGVPKLSAVSLLLAQQALAQAHGTGVADETINSLRARLEDVTGAQGKAQQMTTLARDIEREARARADEIDSLVHLFARTRGAKNYCIKAEDSTSKAQLYDIDAQQGWVATKITDALPHGAGATLTKTGAAKLKGCARGNNELAIEGAGNTSLFAQIQALTVDLAATQRTTKIFKADSGSNACTGGGGSGAVCDCPLTDGASGKPAENDGFTIGAWQIKAGNAATPTITWADAGKEEAKSHNNTKLGRFATLINDLEKWKKTWEGMAALCQEKKLTTANITLGNMCGKDQDKHVQDAAALLKSLTRRETTDTQTQEQTTHGTRTTTHTDTTRNEGKTQHDTNKAKPATQTGTACEDETGAQGTWAVVQGKRVCTATSSTPAMRAWPLALAAQTPHAWALA
ncbi:hypothetical protein, conserved in T. vivax [Trypanosoma vivax Y486]|uniref:Trypanosome variant surface glycoprotein A-type N-terminal domain-containing protein n=1 Tax=Trypanosoma vivax (strain Y486) TaxID=1055687 RepID=F9WNL1_TRYVY|nr:hypothetical protein, conserved in T. vivax [Trypanosoma vivax Y486]|eukprot:CCD19129.1 hypothetical protein, conserved in T. vivax [Trypanosoma vivax Y486]